MNKSCARCRHASNLINGRYCNIVQHYVEHCLTMPCMESSCVAREKCKVCVWHSEIMMGDIWCDLHRKSISEINECVTFSESKRRRRI